MTADDLKQTYAFDYESSAFTRSLAIHADCYEWMRQAPAESMHAIVTDPPYEIKEYDPDQLENAQMVTEASGASLHRLTVTTGRHCHGLQRSMTGKGRAFRNTFTNGLV